MLPTTPTPRIYYDPRPAFNVLWDDPRYWMPDVSLPPAFVCASHDR